MLKVQQVVKLLGRAALYAHVYSRTNPGNIGVAIAPADANELAQLGQLIASLDDDNSQEEE